MRRPGLLALILGMMALVPPQPARASGAHALVTATVTYRPETPAVGELWHVVVVVQSADAALHPERRVRIVGEMSGHPMRPVEAALLPDGSAAGAYAGALSFTMGGPWRITVHLDDLNQAQLATFDVNVVAGDVSTGGLEMRTTLYLHEPLRPNLVPPGWIALATLGLVLAMQASAFVAKRRATVR